MSRCVLMGEFSYMCKKCGRAVNHMESCIFFLLDKGRVVECQIGVNSNYGCVINKNAKTVFDEHMDWDYDEWTNLVDLHFNDDVSSGFSVFHQACYDGVPPTTISEDDPNQGWGNPLRKNMNKQEYDLCKTCFNKVAINKTYCCEDCAIKGLAHQIAK